MAEHPQRQEAVPSSSARRARGGVWRVVLVVALAVLVAALAALGVIGYSYWQGGKVYEEVAAAAFTAPEDAESADLADFQVDWDALLAANPDTVGWVYIPGTTVNYPIVQTTDDEYYLKHDFQGSEGVVATYGAIFLSAANASDFSDANNIVYGHHLNNGSMFAPLADFGDASVFNEHRTVYVLTPQGNYRLTTFSIVNCQPDDPLAQTAFSGADEQTLYVQDKIDRSEVVVDDLPQASQMTHTFAFATCDSPWLDRRWVLFAYVSECTEGAPGAGAVVDSVESGSEDVAAVNNAAEEIAS